MKNDWNWTEASDEEFKKNNKDMTYYKIYHVVSDEKITDYKFWAKDDTEAFDVLRSFKEDHCDGNEYYFSTSCYYINSNGDRYDCMEDMHEAWKKEPYDIKSRKYDIEKLDYFKKDIKETERNKILDDLLCEIENLRLKVQNLREDEKTLEEKINTSDLNSISEEEMDKLTIEANKLNEDFFSLKENEHLLRTKHGLSESWNLEYHVLDDLRYNLAKLINGKMGYPTFFHKKASEKIGIEYKEFCEPSEEVCKLANEMWTDELKRFRDMIVGYLYFSDYGIVDEKDADIVEYDKLHSSEIPYVEGTLKELDYKKLMDIQTNLWNGIWEWMKEYGQSLWD